MKLKTAKIIVESFETTNQRWKKALQGKVKNLPNEEIITVSSWEVLGKVFSSQRLQILSLIPILNPKSIADLARLLKRDFKNVYSDVKFLGDLGLIELREEGSRKTIIPIAKFSGIELPLVA